MNTQINQLLQKRMDRKDFLKHVALGVAVLSGGAALIKTLHQQPTANKQSQMATGYGSSVYGGVPSPNRRPVQL